MGFLRASLNVNARFTNSSIYYYEQYIFQYYMMVNVNLGVAISLMIHTSVKTRDWLSPVEPRNVRAGKD